MTKPKMVTITAPKSEVNAFLRYFYKIEQLAQNEGYFTGEWFGPGAESFHLRLMKAKKGSA